MPAVLTPGAVVPAPDFGFPSEAEDIVSPVKKRPDYPEMPPQDYLDPETRLAVAEYMLAVKN